MFYFTFLTEIGLLDMKSNDRIADFLKNYSKDRFNMSLSSELHKPRWRIGDIEISRRVLNHWISLGLVDDSREKGKGWNMFSQIDLIWFNLITELRSFGYPLESIMNLRTVLEQGKEILNVNLPLLEMAYHIVVVLDHQGSLNLTKNGIPRLDFGFKDKEGVLLPNEIIDVSYLSINFNKLARMASPLTPTVFTMTNEQLGVESLISYLKNSNYNEVRLKLKNGKIKFIEYDQDFKPGSEIDAIIRKMDYCEVTLQKHDGRITTYKITEKMRFETDENKLRIDNS